MAALVIENLDVLILGFIRGAFEIDCSWVLLEEIDELIERIVVIGKCVYDVKDSRMGGGGRG